MWMREGGRRDRKKENDRWKGAKERKKERSRVRRERTKEEWERKGKQSPHTITITSLVPRHSKISENSAWYPLFTHTWLPRFSEELGNYCDTSPCCTTIHY